MGGNDDEPGRFLSGTNISAYRVEGISVYKGADDLFYASVGLWRITSPCSKPHTGLPFPDTRPTGPLGPKAMPGGVVPRRRESRLVSPSILLSVLSCRLYSFHVRTRCRPCSRYGHRCPRRGSPEPRPDFHCCSLRSFLRKSPRSVVRVKASATPATPQPQTDSNISHVEKRRRCRKPRGCCYVKALSLFFLLQYQLYLSAGTWFFSKHLQP